MLSLYSPTKTEHKPNSLFFQPGTIELRARWLTEDSDATHSEMIHEEAEALKEATQPIYCEHHSCYNDGNPLMLPSVGAYELHYEARHLNTCSVCEKVFPSAHWLQLHLDECHDVLKKIQKERGEKIYACYVEGCQKHFMEPKLRRLHLVDKHHYPKYFPFDIVLTGSLNYDQWKKHEKRQKTINKHHKAEELPIKGESEPVDIDMDDLTDHLKRLKIPKTISFGRGAKASLSRHLPHANSSTNLPIDDCVNVQEDTTMDISIVEDNNSTRPRRKRGPKKKKNTPATTL